MEDWRINDYKIRCYNLQNKLTPYEADMIEIDKRAKRIRRSRKCGMLTALTILKKRLEKEVAKKSGK